MSVLIKGMNIPYGCANCDFVGSPVYDSKGRAIYSCNVPVENIRGKDVTDHVFAMHEGARMSFPKWCPLVDLGKHGRLIDADATIKEIKARNPYDVSYEDAWAITCIEHASTIVESEGET